MFLCNWPIKTLSLTSEEGFFFLDQIKAFSLMYGRTSKCQIFQEMWDNITNVLQSQRITVKLDPLSWIVIL